MKLVQKKVIMNKSEMARSLRRLAYEIIEKIHNDDNLVLVGIQTRGVYLAQRIGNEIKNISRKTVPIGTLDITLYRDDVDAVANQPTVKETKLPFDITGKDVILVDDVLFTGRTIRAALDEIIDFGRPKTIKLAVLIDRGCRELPIQPDFAGERFPTSRKEAVNVSLEEIDKQDSVILYNKKITKA